MAVFSDYKIMSRQRAKELIFHIVIFWFVKQILYKISVFELCFSDCFKVCGFVRKSKSIHVYYLPTFV